MCRDLAFAIDGVALSKSIVASVDVATSSRAEPSVASDKCTEVEAVSSPSTFPIAAVPVFRNRLQSYWPWSHVIAMAPLYFRVLACGYNATPLSIISLPFLLTNTIVASAHYYLRIVLPGLHVTPKGIGKSTVFTQWPKTAEGKAHSNNSHSLK